MSEKAHRDTLRWFLTTTAIAFAVSLAVVIVMVVGSPAAAPSTVLLTAWGWIVAVVWWRTAGRRARSNALPP